MAYISFPASPVAKYRLAMPAANMWMLRGALMASLALVAMIILLLNPYPVAHVLMHETPGGPAGLKAVTFNIDAELGSLLLTDAVETVDLAANADMASGGGFVTATGPPFNLLAQLEPRSMTVPASAAIAPVLAGPVLTVDEKMIVTANGERREIHIALIQLRARAESGETGVAAAIAVEPLLRRAEHAAKRLDGYGDALLLSEGEAMKQVAFFGFYASRAAALNDIERAEAMLGQGLMRGASA